MHKQDLEALKKRATEADQLATMKAALSPGQACKVTHTGVLGGLAAPGSLLKHQVRADVVPLRKREPAPAPRPSSPPPGGPSPGVRLPLAAHAPCGEEVRKLVGARDHMDLTKQAMRKGHDLSFADYKAAWNKGMAKLLVKSIHRRC